MTDILIVPHKGSAIKVTTTSSAQEFFNVILKDGFAAYNNKPFRVIMLKAIAELIELTPGNDAVAIPGPWKNE